MTTPLSPIELLFMNYAAGRVTQEESLMVAAAVALNADARRKVEEFEAMGASLMCAGEPAEVSSACMDAVMERIAQGSFIEPVPDLPAPKPPEGLNVPEIVYAMIHSVCASKSGDWQRAVRNTTIIDLEMRQREPAMQRLRLLKIAPMQSTPRHRHIGKEITLVLHGSYTDGIGRYVKGDIILIHDARIEHQPTAEEEGCVCLTLTEAPLKFLHPFTRITNLFLKV
ncbi:MAG: ChrR family anti-sigma-E factor [Micavibrio sp.]|nr:ChrR family anti-sigma-E factor [Micavibrio sp.]